MTIEIEKEVDIPDTLHAEEIINDIIEEAIDYVNCPYETEINVILTDNEQIATINKDFRQIDKATDVLSFPNVDYESPADFDSIEENAHMYFNPETGELVLGDIIISIDKAMEQAKEYGHSPKREIAFLTAHSMLHLFGYDHMDEEERKVMEQKQEEILTRRGYVREV